MRRIRVEVKRNEITKKPSLERTRLRRRKRRQRRKKKEKRCQPGTQRRAMSFLKEKKLKAEFEEVKIKKGPRRKGCGKIKQGTLK